MLSILKKTEKACETILAESEALPEGINLYTGLDNEKKRAPCIICHAESATEENEGLRIWQVQTSIKVKETFKETDVDSELAGDVFDIFSSGDIRETLTNSIEKYFVYDVFLGEPRNETTGDAWEQTLSLTIVCAHTN